MINRIFKFLPIILFSLMVACEQMGVQPDEDNTPPKAYFTISPSTGDSTKSFLLSGLNSSDAEIRDTQMSRDNGIYEKYCYQNDPSRKDPLGGYYTYYHWDEVIDYDTIGLQGLCPPGWKLPGMSDWDTLMDPIRDRGISYFSAGGFSRLNLTKIGIHELTKTWETIDECPCTAGQVHENRRLR
ncbi:MAG: FISUMP domain-containing protein [Bacteroidales bacterium]